MVRDTEPALMENAVIPLFALNAGLGFSFKILVKDELDISARKPM